MRPVAKRQWMAAITTTSTLTPTTRLALLAIANEHMTANGSLVIGVEKLAGGAKNTAAMRRFSRYFQAAYEGCWLRQTSPGRLGHAATYTAAIPEPGECQQRRPRKGMTDKKCQSTSPEMTDTLKQSSHPEMTDKKCQTISKDIQGELRERVAVDEHADDETTTAASAALPPRPQVAAAHQRKATGMVRSEIRTTPEPPRASGTTTTAPAPHPERVPAFDGRFLPNCRAREDARPAVTAGVYVCRSRTGCSLTDVKTVSRIFTPQLRTTKLALWTWSRTSASALASNPSTGTDCPFRSVQSGSGRRLTATAFVRSSVTSPRARPHMPTVLVCRHASMRCFHHHEQPVSSFSDSTVLPVNCSNRKPHCRLLGERVAASSLSTVARTEAAWCLLTTPMNPPASWCAASWAWSANTSVTSWASGCQMAVKPKPRRVCTLAVRTGSAPLVVRPLITVVTPFQTQASRRRSHASLSCVSRVSRSGSSQRRSMLRVVSRDVPRRGRQCRFVTSRSVQPTAAGLTDYRCRLIRRSVLTNSSVEPTSTTATTPTVIHPTAVEMCVAKRTTSTTTISAATAENSRTSWSSLSPRISAFCPVSS